MNRNADFDFSHAEQLAAGMKRANVQMVQINGHGETTMLPNWHQHCRTFQNQGIKICITSNFAVIYADEEIDALAKMAGVTVSIDTVDRELLRAIRRKVDLRTILYNMQRVRLRARAADRTIAPGLHRLPIAKRHHARGIAAASARRDAPVARGCCLRGQLPVPIGIR